MKILYYKAPRKPFAHLRFIITALFLLVIFSSCKKEPQTIETYPLSSVSLADGPFLNAQQRSLEYILKLETDRLLAPFHIEAGIEPRDSMYGNWESIGPDDQSGLGGHIGGHYLTALSLMYESSGKQVLLERLNYMINELAKCQEKHGDGYVGGVPEGRELWKEIEEGKINARPFRLNTRWVPWYNLHKLFAGLRDAYLITGNEDAREILVNLSDWCYDLISKLSEEQMQKMLQTEFGGMNEVLADVADITGEEKYLSLAKRFNHKEILEPLLDKRDELTGLHANTQIPKVVGFKRIGEISGDQELEKAAKFFWNTVVENRTVSIGGNSVHEHFNPVDDFSTMMEDPNGPETCNTYNMLRLTKMLFLSDPQARYIDYYERALYNHILSSIHPETGGYVYLTPMRPQHYRVYSQPHENFWCCVGTGLENHGKYGELIYARQGDDVFVNLFIPSTLEWEEKGITLNQTTDFPFEESSNLKLHLENPQTFALNIRYPGWIEKDEMRIHVNGEEIEIDHSPSSYVSIEQRWNPGDEISIELPMRTKLEYLPDNSPWASILHGPIVLAAKTGDEDLEGLFAVDEPQRWEQIADGPLYPKEEAPSLDKECLEEISSHIMPVEDKRLRFNFSREIITPSRKAEQLVLKPFFQIHEARYMIYWPVE